MMYRNVGALVQEQTTISLGPKASVQEAAEQMAEHRVGAIPIIDSRELKGLFTERDLLNRVVAKGLTPERVRLEEVMTRDPITVESDASLVHSLKTMLENKVRHLPVLESGQVRGVLSCRDIPAEYWIMWENWVNSRNELRAV
jgi:CBS domain-containing protein